MISVHCVLSAGTCGCADVGVVAERVGADGEGGEGRGTQEATTREPMHHDDDHSTHVQIDEGETANTAAGTVVMIDVVKGEEKEAEREEAAAGGWAHWCWKVAAVTVTGWVCGVWGGARAVLAGLGLWGTGKPSQLHYGQALGA